MILLIVNEVTESDKMSSADRIKRYNKEIFKQEASANPFGGLLKLCQKTIMVPRNLDAEFRFGILVIPTSQIEHRIGCIIFFYRTLTSSLTPNP